MKPHRIESPCCGPHVAAFNSSLERWRAVLAVRPRCFAAGRKRAAAGLVDEHMSSDPDLTTWFRSAYPFGLGAARPLISSAAVGIGLAIAFMRG
jgi:hypothetical protein